MILSSFLLYKYENIKVSAKYNIQKYDREVQRLDITLLKTREEYDTIDVICRVKNNSSNNADYVRVSTVLFDLDDKLFLIFAVDVNDVSVGEEKAFSASKPVVSHTKIRENMIGRVQGIAYPITGYPITEEKAIEGTDYSISEGAINILYTVEIENLSDKYLFLDIGTIEILDEHNEFIKVRKLFNSSYRIIAPKSIGYYYHDTMLQNVTLTDNISIKVSPKVLIHKGFQYLPVTDITFTDTVEGLKATANVTNNTELNRYEIVYIVLYDSENNVLGILRSGHLFVLKGETLDFGLSDVYMDKNIKSNMIARYKVFTDVVH